MSISLKKAFEYQNYFKILLNQAYVKVGAKDVGIDTVEKHNRTKAYKDGVDEEIVPIKTVELPCGVIEYLDFIQDVLSKKEELTQKINEAKVSSTPDFDTLISTNNIERNFLKQLYYLTIKESSETQTQGRDYKFDETGNQVTYVYPVTVVKTINYDRNAVKAIVSRIRKECDARSEQIELMQLETKIDFDTIYEIGDSLDDAYEKYAENKY